MVTQEYRYGTGTILLEDKVRRRRDGLDGGTRKYLSEAHDTFLPGGFITGDWGTLEIEEAEAEKVGSTDWEHNLMLIGVLGGRSGARREIGYPKMTSNLEGWDEGNDCLIVQGGAVGNYARGTFMAGQSYMVCMSCPKENIYGDWWRVSPQYKGIMGSRPSKRVITVNEEVMSPSDPITVTLPAGWPTPRKAQISLPKLVVRDTNVVVNASDTSSIPGEWTPPNAPSIQNLSITGNGLTYRWPHSWKIASIDRDEIPGTDIALETLTWEYVWPASF